MSETFITLWPYLAKLSRVWLLLLGVILFMSIKYQRISEAIFYVGMFYVINEALLQLPESPDWYANPSTKLITMIFSFIDKSLPQSIFVLIFWAV